MKYQKFIAIICIIFSLKLSGQCLTTVIDDFTGIETQKTTPVKLSNIIKPSYSIALVSVDSVEYFELIVTAPNLFAFEVGNSLYLKFADTILVLNSSSFSTSTSTPTGNTTIYKSRMLFKLNDYTITHLSNWDLSKFRVYTAESYLEDEIPMQEAVEIRNISKCFNKRKK